MTSLPQNAGMQEIEDELLFQQTLLDTLDDKDHAPDDRRREIEAIIADLELRMARATTAAAAGSSSRSSSSPAVAYDARAHAHVHAHAYANTRPPSHNYNLPGSHPPEDHGLPASYPPAEDHDLPELGMPTPTRPAPLKRPYASVALTANADATPFPFKRPTPNPPADSVMGPPSSRQEAWIERQRQIEAAAQRRREDEAADAAFATRLSQQPASSPVAGPSRTNSGQRVEMSPSKMAPPFRPPGYRPRLQEPPPPASPAVSHVKHESHPGPNYATPPRHVKPEHAPLHPHSAPPTRGPTVIDLTASDDDESTRSRHPMPLDRMSNPAQQHHIWQQQQHEARAQLDLERRQAVQQAQQQQALRQHWQRAMQAQQNPHLAEQLRQQQMLQLQQMHYARPYQPQSSTMSPNLLCSQPGMRPNNPLRSSSQSAVPRYDEMDELSNLLHGRRTTTRYDVPDRSDPYAADSDDDLRFVGSQARRSAYDDLGSLDLYDSEKAKEDLRKLVENIQPDTTSIISSEDDVPIEGLTIKLKPYQNAGLEWLQKMEDGSNKGGILADDMGLGKTVQAISLMVTRRSEDPVCKTTLILAPVALLRQWEQEIMTKIKPGRHRLHTFIHHAGTKKKNHRDLREFDVVLTTFGTIAAELKKIEKFELRKKADPEARPRDDEKCLFVGSDCKWYRIIIDEAQCIKNRTTKTARAAYLIQARSRFCMTGTPMMNSVEELFSLIQFLRIKPYNNWNRFRSDFVQPLRSTHEAAREGAMQKLQALLRAILLRRNKQTKINGRPILNLPERSVEEANPVFDPDERDFYNSLENKTAITVNKYLKAGTVGRQYAHILVLLLRLRQACCHPHLIKDFGVVGATAEISQETMNEICRNLDPGVVKRIKEANGSFECPVCYDAVENPAIFAPCGHDTCPDCFTRIADPAQALAEGEEGRSAKCPQCRGVINVKNVLDYECFKRIHMPEEVEPAESSVVDAAIKGEIMDTDDDDDSDDEDDSDVDSETDSRDGFIVNDENQNPPDEAANDDEDAAERKYKAALKAKAAKGKAKAKKSRKAKGKRRASVSKEEKKKKAANMSIPELKKMANRSTYWRKMYLKMIKKGFITSAKIEKTMEILRPILAGQDNEKIIIFSQWTSLLDLLEVPISDAGWGYRRYDGSMNAKLRADAVDDFKNRPNVRAMLVSLKAGNAGLNLNCASQVIILDPFWNPYIEEQAIDRAHRLGQTRPVKVHRVLIKETVEDRIIQLQEKKRQLISQALDEKASQSLGRLSIQELAYLFGINRAT